MGRRFTLKCKYCRALSIQSYLFLCHVCPLPSSLLPYLSYYVKTQRMDMVQRASRLVNTWGSGGEWGAWRAMKPCTLTPYLALCISLSGCWFASFIISFSKLVNVQQTNKNKTTTKKKQRNKKHTENDLQFL